ncbi:MAG: TIGR02680 family protein, partial [Herbaspirillum sp.]|uniref:TIGR02680 family protein n=1 Tax=Herbaspirillum sp. TaxID=1890675 RepID=UPI002587E84A
MTTLPGFDPGHGERPALPRPQRRRWQPLRSGLLNLYRYDHEVFHYEQGHLLLRGNNGTGKSRVLALQLPFLLDGDVASHRVEPDRDPAKRIDWNLLMGRHPDRLGYTWVELGRRDEDGGEHFLTLGCGLHAVAGRGLVGKWLFLTEQRVGEDLFLETASGQALSKARLIEAVGEHGEVFTAAARFRAAVDRRLFQLGEARYQALIDLLIELRQPQLSRNLKEDKLSQALSNALPPLSPSLLDDVADAFRSLEDERLAVQHLEAARDGVEVFLKSYERYVRIAARRRAERLRTAHAAYESTMRLLRAAEASREEAERRLAEVRLELDELELAAAEASAAVRTLEASPEMRDKKALDDAVRLAEERRIAADSARRDHADAGERIAQREQEETAAASAADAAREEAVRRLDDALAAARAAGLESEHRAVVAPLDLPAGVAPDAARSGAARLDESASRRRRASRHVAELNQALAAAESELAHARRHEQQLVAELDDAREHQQHARAAFLAALDDLNAAYGTWHGELRVLASAAPGDLAEELAAWSEAADGVNPVTHAVREAEAEAARRLAAKRAALEGRRDQARSALAELRHEMEELERGVHRPPPLAHTRSPEGRERRAGAPLWQLCDFVPELPEDERAGLEAALEAAGLLDAWLTPDGRLLEAGDADALLLPERSAASPPPADACLALALHPAPERQVEDIDDDVVLAVLREIGLGQDQGTVWVSADGRFQLGPLHGRWEKPAAQHLGRSAREAERRRRLVELAEQAAAAETALHEAESRLARHGDDERQARREAAEAPATHDVERTLAGIGAAAEAVRRARDRLAEAEPRVAEARRTAAAARDERDTTAQDLGLADQVDRLPALDEALTVYAAALGSLWPTLSSAFHVGRQAAAAAERTTEARRDEEHRAALHREAEQRARQAAAERDTLRSTVGAAVEEVLRRLEATRAEAGRLQGKRRSLEEDRRQLEVKSAVADEKIRAQEERLEQERQVRDTATEGLGRFVVSGLIGVAVPSLEDEDPGEWSTRRSVEVARAIEVALGQVDSGDEAWERNQKNILHSIETLKQNLLAQGYQPYSELTDDLLVVRVPYQGRDCGVVEIRAHLAADLAERQSILSAREREVIENHLIGEVASHLHEHLHRAEELVREMNAELQARPMSTGMTLRFAWEPVPDGPAGLVDARRRLLGTRGTWSPAEREALGTFLHELIRSERARDEGTWRHQLERALDYRAWHRFSVERRQDGVWKRLTRRTHGTGSGGEKAIALTIPQFAAAAAHYRTAGAHAPRLILLDEAFVGIDADMRSKCMGLLDSFDLDFVMTSEREWGCYATLPGLAIYQLATRPG